MFRSIARICLATLHRLEAEGPHWNFHRWSRDAEYSAELALIVNKDLAEREAIIFREYFIRRRTWQAVDRQTRIGRGNFFHAAYRAEVKFGRAILARDLFPPYAYFSGLYAERPGPSGASWGYQLFREEAA